MDLTSLLDLIEFKDCQVQDGYHQELKIWYHSIDTVPEHHFHISTLLKRFEFMGINGKPGMFNECMIDDDIIEHTRQLIIRHKEKFCVCQKSFYPVMISSLLLAIKCDNDFYPDCAFYSRITSLSKKLVNELELKFLVDSGFRLYFPKNENNNQP